METLVRSTFSPDANPEVNSIDGAPARGVASETFTANVTGNGNQVTDSSANNAATLRTAAAAPNFSVTSRVHLGFDTSAIPDGDTIYSAIVRLRAVTVLDEFAEAASLVLTPNRVATANLLFPADFEGMENDEREVAPRLTLASLLDGVDFAFQLNALGRGLINKQGTTEFAVRISFDIDEAEPTHPGSVVDASVNMGMADGANAPVLVVEHGFRSDEAPQVPAQMSGGQPASVRYTMVGT